MIVGPQALALAGCSRGPKLVPVSGRLLYEGKPAVGATVVFIPAAADSAAIRPTEYVEADGSFVLNTHPLGRGAPPGEYKVTTTLYPPNFKDLDDAKSLLSERYESADAGLLRATVRDGATTLESFMPTKLSSPVLPRR